MVGAIGAILSLGSLAYVMSRRATLAAGIPLGAVLVAGSALGPGPPDATSVSSDLLIVALTLAVGDLLRFRDVQQALLRLRNQQLQDLREAETAAAVVAERMRIARDIHDAVGHGLVAITLHARAGKRRLGRAPDRSVKPLSRSTHWRPRPSTTPGSPSPPCAPRAANRPGRLNRSLTSTP